jgi:predicted dehydrogenase
MRSRSSDHALRVGFIGAGSVLWAYLQVLDRLIPCGIALEGPICARRRDAWPELLRRRPHARLVESPAQVVDSDTDVVCVLTPPESHAALARLALEHGKHVVVEKPLAPHRADAEALVALAAEQGVTLLAAPFVQLSPTFRALWSAIDSGAIGRVHSARGLYGNAGSTWAAWYHSGGVGPLAEVGIYNLKSLTALLGPVTRVLAAEGLAVPRRRIDDVEVVHPGPDVSHVIAEHEGGALSSIVSSQAIQRYRRPALELYGTDGTANLLGDDWDPHGYELWRIEAGSWEQVEPVDATWLWADGLRECVASIREGRAPLQELAQDLHLLDVIDAARRSARSGRAAQIGSWFAPLDLTLEPPAGGHVHDRTRPADQQS